MNLAVSRQHVGAKADAAGTTRMEPCSGLAGDLDAGRRTQGTKHRFDIGLGVVQIKRAAAGMRVTLRRGTNQNGGRLHQLITGFAALKRRADLEQGQIGNPTRLIAGDGAQKSRQQVRAQVGHLG